MELPANTTISGVVTHDLAWLKAHLILLALVVLLVGGSVYGVESIIARHDHDNFLRQDAIVQQLTQQNQAIQQETKAEIDALMQKNAVLQQEIDFRDRAIAARDAQLKMTQAQVPQLSPTALSAEWQKQIKVGSVQPTQNGYIADAPAAIATVQALEAIPVLQQDVQDLQKSNGNLTTELSNETAIYEAEKKSHASDNAENKAVIDAKTAEIKDVKAQCRKSKLKWFGIGYAAGWLSRKLVGF